MAIALFEAFARRHKPPLPPPDLSHSSGAPAPFEIPTLANDPDMSKPKSLSASDPSAEVIQLDRVNDVAELYAKRQNLIQSRSSVNSVNQAVDYSAHSEPQHKEERLSPSVLNLSQADALDAMILSEIFNKPKSLRNR